MVKFIKILFVALFVALINSCGLIGIDSFFESGYFNEEHRYVPKHPNYRLKDKKGFIFPSNLDTNHVYKLAVAYYLGKQKYPFIPANFNFASDTTYYFHYMKFYSDGRVRSFTKDVVNLGDEYKLQKSDLNPDLVWYSNNYFFCKNGKKIQIESFNRGDGWGTYWRSDYVLNDLGDTLFYIKINDFRVYVLDSISPDWNTYKADW